MDSKMEENKKVEMKRDLNYPTLLWCVHILALWPFGLWLLLFEAKWMTVFFAIFITTVGSIGITMGAHRLWAHQSFCASKQIRFFLMLAHTLAGVGPIHDWVLTHRMHHKFYGTEKDPYNHKRGFLYCHLLTNFMTNLANNDELGKQIDMRDIHSDGFVWIQKKFYWPLFLIVCILLPINAPTEYWGESLGNSFFILGFLRLAICLNVSWLVNSGMLIWGLQKGAKYPVDDNSVFFVSKSYWPNYHYLLPWDWKTGEFGGYENGLTTFFIKVSYELGLVNGLKTNTSEEIREALFNSTRPKTKFEDVVTELRKISEEEANNEKLRHYH